VPTFAEYVPVVSTAGTHGDKTAVGVLAGQVGHPQGPDVLDWAGQLRSVSIAKGSVFCLPQHLESYAADVFGRLAAAERLRGLAASRSSAAWLGASPTSTHCTRSATATAAPSGHSSPS
jgi:hypothetical protein